MRDETNVTRSRVRPVLAVAACAAFLLAGAFWAPAAHAAPTPPGGALVKVGQDAVVDPDAVVARVVVVGGDVTVAGIVDGSVVAVGGNVKLLPSAAVYGKVVTVAGKIDRRPGALVAGSITAVGLGPLPRAARWIVSDPIRHPFQPGTLFGWLGATVLYALVALIACALIPDNVAAVRTRIGAHPWASLGWGALGVLVLVPVGSMVLIATVVGILVVIPGLVVVVPFAFFFGYVCLGTLVGSRLLRALGGGGNQLLAALIGVVVLHLLRLVPVAGTVVWLLVWMTGFGATYMAAYEGWRRRRHGVRAAVQTA